MVFKTKWMRFVAQINEHLENSFYLLGRFSSRHPKSVILASVSISLACTVGILAVNIETRVQKLWVPQNSQALKNGEFFQDSFGNQLSSISCILIVYRKDGASVLEKQTLQEALQLQKTVEDITIKYEGNTFNFRDLCKRVYSTSECQVNSALDYWDSNEFKLNSDSDLLATVSKRKSKNGIGFEISQHAVIGGLLKNSTGAALSAKSIKMIFSLKLNAASKEWAKEFLKVSRNYQSDLVQVNYYESNSDEDELNRAIAGDVGLFIVAVVMMCSYASLSIGEAHPVKSRILLGIGGVLGIVLSILMGFGISCMFGVAFTPVTQILPFILMGIGLDDMFVIVNSVEIAKLTDPKKNITIEHIVGSALSVAGVSITMTTATDALAFYTGYFCDLPGVSAFCVYAGTCMLCDFVFQITFFCAVLSLDCSRIRNSRMDIVPCRIIDYRDFPEKRNEPITLNENVNNEASRFFFTRLMKFIYFNLYMRTFVIFTFICTIGMSVYQIQFLEEGLSTIEYFSDDSYLIPFITRENEDFRKSGAPLFLIFKQLDYTDSKVQRGVQVSTDAFANKFESVSCWMDNFIGWAEIHMPHVLSPADGNFHKAVFRDDFYPAFRTFITSSQLGEANRHFIQWEKTYQECVLDTTGESCRIKASTCTTSVPIGRTSDSDIEIMQQAQALTKTSLVPMAAWTEEFSRAELYVMIRDELYRNLGFALLAVLIVTFLTLGDPILSLFLISLVALIDLQAMALLSILGVTVNPISFICLLSSIGLTYDFPAHLLHVFSSSMGTRIERMMDAMNTIGMSILSGAATTFLGVLALSAAGSNIFRTMFLCFATIITVALLHTFVLVPVIMAWIGPASHHSLSEIFPECVESKDKKKRLSVRERVDSKFSTPRGLIKTSQLSTARDEEPMAKSTRNKSVEGDFVIPPQASGTTTLESAEIQIHLGKMKRYRQLFWGIRSLMVAILIGIIASFFDFSKTLPSTPPGAQPIVMPSESVNVSTSVTGRTIPFSHSFMCVGIRLPEDTIYHLIGARATFKTPSTGRVLIRRCNFAVDETPWACSEPPRDCESVLFVLSSTSPTFTLPPNVGLRAGRHSNNIQLLAQFHHWTPSATVDEISSGISLHLTRRLKDFSAGIITVGTLDTHIVGNSASALCSPHHIAKLVALSTGSVSSAVTVFANSFEAHSKAVSISSYDLRHNGTTYVPISNLGLAPFYSWASAATEVVASGMVAGMDAISLQCTFSAPVSGGANATQERCRNHLLFYPTPDPLHNILTQFLSNCLV